jgi:hypothetical protein
LLVECLGVLPGWQGLTPASYQIVVRVTDPHVDSGFDAGVKVCSVWAAGEMEDNGGAGPGDRIGGLGAEKPHAPVPSQHHSESLMPAAWLMSHPPLGAGTQWTLVARQATGDHGHRAPGTIGDAPRIMMPHPMVPGEASWPPGDQFPEGTGEKEKRDG